MSGIQWLLVLLRKLCLGNTLVQASIRGLLFLFSVLSRAIKKRPNGAANSADDDSPNPRIICPQAYEHDGGKPYSAHSTNRVENRVLYASASVMPSSLHPYPHSGPNASRSSQAITAHPITQLEESYSLEHLPAQHPTLSAQHSVSSPSPDLGLGSYLSSSNTSAPDLHPPGPATGSPSQARRSSQDVTRPSFPPLLNEANPRIFPGTPESVRRYERKAFAPDEPTQFTLPPLTISLLPNPPPAGWTVYQHPEGARYFFHEEKRVFTDANLFDPPTLTFINDNVRTINDFLRANGIQLESDVDFVLDEYIYLDQSKGCQYYFVNHQDRCVFWMDKADSDMMFPIMRELNGVTSASHIRHELEAQYWNHCEFFPRSFEVTHEILDELRDILLHALGDLVTSVKSTVSWKIEELNNMINLIDGFGENVDRGNVNKKFSGASCLVGRLMQVFVRARVYNFHGEPSARLNVGESVYTTIPSRTLLIKLLSPLLFYAPDLRLVDLKTIYTDGLIRHRRYSGFIKDITSDWQNFHTLYATVLLNVNVAFLAIQSVDNNSVTNRSPTQISCYLSMLMSIGSIIIGLQLVEKNRDRDRVTAPDAAKFTLNRTNPTLGLETLAILYSLPYALLIWSMVSFLVAFLLMCFEKSNLVTRTLVAVIWTVVAVLILWCVFTVWEGGDWDWPRDLLSYWRPSADAGEEGQGDAVQDGATSAVSNSKPWKSWWTIALRKSRITRTGLVTNA